MWVMVVILGQAVEKQTEAIVCFQSLFISFIFFSFFYDTPSDRLTEKWKVDTTADPVFDNPKAW